MSVIILAMLLVGCAAAFVCLVVRLIQLLVRRGAAQSKGVKRSMIALMIGIALVAALALVTQWTAHTPAIGEAGGVAELRQVTLNGRKEWISVRGNDRSAPVLLFLAGGPGGTQMGAVRQELGELEQHFVVVNWDQPGAGKSYNAAPITSLTPQMYIDDGLALTRQLCAEFGQEKIYLMGESWGSALGIFLIDAQPELYRAFIGTGQMVAFEETERIDYQLAMDMATAEGNERLVQQLSDNGQPPYHGSDVTWKSAAYLNYLGGKMAGNPQVTNGGYNTVRDLLSAEYGLIDKINFVRGVIDTFNHVYPQLYTLDLRNEYTQLQVPVYFFLGRHDLNAPVSLAEDYMDKLVAPEKQIIWFEHSGHSPWINEPDVFIRHTLEVAAKH